MKILIALSGGIDSSVAAYILKKEGHELIAVRFTLWSDPLAPALAHILPQKCCNAQTAARAASVAATLSIPLHILNLEKEFKTQVVDPFLEGYRTGTTPNPCIGCNRTIKFGALLRFAKKLKCEKLATGHYARIRCVTRNGKSHYELKEATDRRKDQSYFLYGLTQSQLSQVQFPLGNIPKSSVREYAKKCAIPYDEELYRESQDLCFFPEKTPKQFLKRHLHKDLKEGDIKNTQGKRLGHHNGLPLLTIGQSRGINIGGQKIKLEVVHKDYSENTIYVDHKGKTKIKSVQLTSLHWTGSSPPSHTIDTSARTRSLGPHIPGTLSWTKDAGTFTFHTPESPLACGQSLVFYDNETVKGGGIIASTSLASHTPSSTLNSFIKRAKV